MNSFVKHSITTNSEFFLAVSARKVEAILVTHFVMQERCNELVGFSADLEKEISLNTKALTFLITLHHTCNNRLGNVFSYEYKVVPSSKDGENKHRRQTGGELPRFSDVSRCE